MSISLTPQQLSGFLQVAATGSFSEAARALSVSQPALSRTVRTIEEIVGERLFDRDTRHVILTPAGEALRPIAERLVAEFANGLSELAQFVAGKRGQVTVAALPSLAAVLLPNVLRRFRVQYPAVEFVILDGASGSVLDLVIQRQADLGLTVQPPPHDGLVYQPLLSDAFGLVCRADDRLSTAEEPLGWSVFADRPYIAMAAGSSVRATTAAAFAQTGIAVSPLYECATLGTAGHLIASGLGIMALPRLTLPLMAADLVWRPLSQPLLHRHIGIVTPARRSLAPAARAFLDGLVAETDAANRRDWTGPNPGDRLATFRERMAVPR
jgi:LysR family transcriptional regulator, carnitine catabolism transcriptional activator